MLYPLIADRLKETLGLERVFVGDPPANVPPPYLFVWGPIPVEDETPLSLVDEQFNIQVIAKASPEVNALAARVISAVAGFTPQVPGYDCQPVRVRRTTPATSDQQILEPGSGTRPAYLTVICEFKANRKANHE